MKLPAGGVLSYARLKGATQARWPYCSWSRVGNPAPPGVSAVSRDKEYLIAG